MSVTSVREPLVVVPIDLPANGYPVAMWMGGATVTGNATGGNAIMIIGPSSIPEAVGYTWSLDGWSASCSTIANAQADWDPGWPQLSTVTRIVEMGRLGFASSNTFQGAGLHLALLPLTHPVPRTPWSLVVSIQNVNGESFFASGWGRCWPADALRKSGPKGWMPS